MYNTTVEPLYNGHPWDPKFLSVIMRCPYLRGLQYISGRHGMHNRAVEHNVAAFSELSFAIPGAYERREGVSNCHTLVSPILCRI